MFRHNGNMRLRLIYAQEWAEIELFLVIDGGTGTSITSLCRAGVCG